MLRQGIVAGDRCLRDCAAVLTGPSSGVSTPAMPRDNMDPISIAVMNAGEMAASTMHTITLPFEAASAKVLLRDAAGGVVTSQISPGAVSGTSELSFVAAVDAVGISTYIAQPYPSSSATVPGSAVIAVFEKMHSSDSVIASACLNVHIDTGDGRMVSMQRTASGEVAIPGIAISQQFYMYDNSASGSYYFSPTGPAAPAGSEFNSTKILRGPVSTQVLQVWHGKGGSPSLQQTLTVRTAADDQLCAVASLSGGNTAPLLNGTELISRLRTNISMSKPTVTWFDGFSMVDSDFNASLCDASNYKLCGGNYKPAVGAAALKPNGPAATPAGPIANLMVGFDRTHGVQTPSVGIMEVMIQRNVGDLPTAEGPACDDTSSVQPPVHLLLTQQHAGGGPAHSASAAQSDVDQLMQMTLSPLRSVVSTPNSQPVKNVGFLKDTAFATGVRLQSLRLWAGRERADGSIQVLLRVVNTRSVGTDPAEVCLSGMINGMSLTDIDEVNVSGVGAWVCAVFGAHR
jgi:hypothetical protein